MAQVTLIESMNDGWPLGKGFQSQARNYVPTSEAHFKTMIFMPKTCLSRVQR